MASAQEIIEALGLEPHPAEGGYFVETYRAAEMVATPWGERSAGTAIYYLLAPGTFSAMHRLRHDEIFHFYAGDPVEQLLLHPEGHVELRVIGPDVAAGMLPQSVVPREVWQGAALAPGGSWALLGTTMAPGFDFEDFEIGLAADLVAEFPDWADRIRALTRA